MREHIMSDLFEHRRDLAILEGPSASRAARGQHTSPSSGSLAQQNAPSAMSSSSWIAGDANSSAPGLSPNDPVTTTFYNDSTDNLSLSSQVSPNVPATSSSRPPPSSRTPATFVDSPEFAYLTDDRRPSVVSIATTASSQGSRTSGARGGLRKLQGFFGEEFPGRDSSEFSLPFPTAGKEHRSHSYSYSRPHRDRNYSNATDHGRDASPSGSRPRTPVPAPEVVPFLYQEVEDIAKYGEAPVREVLTGPDRERFISDSGSQNPPKTSGSGRSGHSIVHLGGHSHRHNKSNDDPRALRPSISREDSISSIPKERSGSSIMHGSRSRAQSPAPSANGSYWGSRSTGGDGQTSPGHQSKRSRFLPRFRKHHKEKYDLADLKKFSASSNSLGSRPSRQDSAAASIEGSEWPVSPDPREFFGPRPSYGRGATFNNKFPFSKKSRSSRQHDDDENIGPTDKQEVGTVFHLDTNLNDMEGIVSRPLPLTPMDSDLINDLDFDKLPIKSDPSGAWFAPDSWGVRPRDNSTQAPEVDDITVLPRPEEKLTNYCIRVFRADDTFVTLQMALDATVHDLISTIVRKTYRIDGIENYHIVMKRRNLIRVLNNAERPLLIQKRLLQQVGYEERDRIEDIGRDDNSYICRFMFLSIRESDFHYGTYDVGLNRMQQKLIHVDLSGRNLVTIPVPLYGKAPDIISLNLSRNLSLDVPRDFIQACSGLKDIKYTNNEARRLPPSFSCAQKLTYLDVSNNRLDQLDHAELGDLRGLLKLNLANNRLKSLPTYFANYTLLRTLTVSSNFLEKFPSFLCDLENLVDLDLSFNLISTLPDNIGNLRSLEKFVITNNRLTGSFPESFKNLGSLRELNFKYNAITNIDVVAQLPKLEILTADHNSISQFVGTFSRLRSLKLNSNPITKFELREPVPTLKVLNLSNCQLASIDESFNNMLNLERLILDRNYFVSLPNQIGNLRRLDHFSIAHNTIGELPPEIGCLTELRVLDVHGNNIRKLPTELWWANKLETLNASSNLLENFPKPASRAPQPPGDPSSTPNSLYSKKSVAGRGLSPMPSSEELRGGDASRRPSQASSTLLSVGPSPVPGAGDRKGSMVSLYGKGGRKTSVVSRSTQSSVSTSMGGPSYRKDSNLSTLITHTFAGSLRYLYLADNHIDDDVFEQLVHLQELRVLNLSYNSLTDMPQRSIKSWSQLTELYLSGNDLTTLPADDLEEYSMLQTLHINDNKFTNLPADIQRAKKLAVLDCGSNSLKYNIANVPYDWNWNLNPNLRYLNLSGNRRLEIKPTYPSGASQGREKYEDFNRLVHLRVLGLMDVTVLDPSVPDENEDRRIRTSDSMAGYLPYGMADTLGKNEHLSTVDLVVPRFNSNDAELLMALFDGQALSSGGSKIAKFLHENFGRIFSRELRDLRAAQGETPEDALRRAFLALNKELINAATSTQNRSSYSVVLSKEDLNSGSVATVVYLNEQELYVANVGDVQAMLIHTDSQFKMLTKKHDPADPHERSRIRDAGGWVSRNGRLNDTLEVSRAFGYSEMMPAVQAAPHVKHHSITEQDEAILVATREVWEYLTPELVVDVYRSVRGDLMRASQKIRDLAMAYGATNKIMVMMLSVADLKRRRERSRMHRGQSMSWFNFPPDDSMALSTRRGKKAKVDGPLDSTLQRLDAEVPAPTGMIAIVFTDIKNSTQLWEMYPEAMRSAIKLHNDTMRRQLRRIGGFEVKTEGDAFMVSFQTATAALLWCFAVQIHLLSLNWPAEMLNSVICAPIFDRNNNLIFRGLSVRMGIHWGEPLAEPDPVTRRMDYFGPMVNKASRISACADGGQITVSSDFIMEIQRCLETYQEGVEIDDENDPFAKSIRQNLRELSSQGFEVKDMGEMKLKGLENPEYIYSLYPHALAGRIDMHNLNQKQRQEAEQKPARLSPDSQLSFDPENVWGLWRIALRLEMLCSSLEDMSGRGLQPPETELMERMRQRGGEVTERFLLNFLEHQVSRIETCVATLAIRHIILSSDRLRQLNDLRAPMASVLDTLQAKLALLERYEARYGPLPPDDAANDQYMTSDSPLPSPGPPQLPPLPLASPRFTEFESVLNGNGGVVSEEK